MNKLKPKTPAPAEKNISENKNQKIDEKTTPKKQAQPAEPTGAQAQPAPQTLQEHIAYLEILRKRRAKD